MIPHKNFSMLSKKRHDRQHVNSQIFFSDFSNHKIASSFNDLIPDVCGRRKFNKIFITCVLFENFSYVPFRSYAPIQNVITFQRNCK